MPCLAIVQRVFRKSGALSCCNLWDIKFNVVQDVPHPILWNIFFRHGVNTRTFPNLKHHSCLISWCLCRLILSKQHFPLFKHNLCFIDLSFCFVMRISAFAQAAVTQKRGLDFQPVPYYRPTATLLTLSLQVMVMRWFWMFPNQIWNFWSWTFQHFWLGCQFVSTCPCWFSVIRLTSI